MVAYARARTKSWLSILWATTDETIKRETVDLLKDQELLKKHAEQKKSFLDASKNGGIWFS